MEGETKEGAIRGRRVCVHMNIYICMNEYIWETKIGREEEDSENKYMKTRKVYLRKQIHVRVGLGVWLRGGTELAWRLEESPNQFHRAEDAPSTCSSQIRLYSSVRFNRKQGCYRSDTQKLPFMVNCSVRTGVPSQQRVEMKTSHLWCHTVELLLHYSWSNLSR